MVVADGQGVPLACRTESASPAEVTLVEGILEEVPIGNEPTPLIAAILFFGGLCRSMQFTSLSTVAFADIPQSQMSSASTLSSMIQQMTIGIPDKILTQSFPAAN